MSRDHRKLETFALADGLTVAVYRCSANFPASERYGLQAQVRRAAVSTATNIVEGCARSSEGDYARFLDIAVGSAREVAYLLDLSSRLGFVNEREAATLTEQSNKTAAKLLRLRATLVRTE